MDKYNTCAECNKEFGGRKKKYCSKECSDEVRRRRKREQFRVENGLYEKYGNKSVCLTCGNKIEGRNLRAVYCSSNCSSTHYDRKNGHKPIEEHLKELRRQTKINQDIKETERQKRVTKNTRVGSCKICGGGFTTLQPSQVTCSAHCSKRWSNRKKDNRINHTNLVDDDISLDKLFIRDEGLCYLCNEKCDANDTVEMDGYIQVGPSYPSIDHVEPLSKGGKHAWNNIKLAHHYCNALKGASDAKIKTGTLA